MARNIKVALTLENNKFNRELNTSKQKVKGFSNDSIVSVKNLGKAFAALGAASLIKSIVTVGQSFQDLRSSLTFAEGGAKAGAAAFSNLTDLATRTQFGVEQLTASYIRLKTAGIEPTNELLLSFASAASITQDQVGTLTAFTELYARAISKAKLEQTDFDKIAERGIDIYGLLREKFRMTVDEIKNLAKTASGQKQLFKGIQEALEETYGAALPEKLKNSSIAFSNLQIAVKSLADETFQAVGLDSTTAVDGLTNSINNLSTTVANLSTSGWDKIIKGLAGIAAGLLLLVKRGKIKGFLKSGMEGFKGAMTGAIVTVDDLGKAVKGTFTPAQNFKAIFKNLGKALKAAFGGHATGQIKEMGKGFGIVNRALASMGQVIFSIGGAFSNLTRLVLGPWGALAVAIDFVLEKFLGFSILGVVWNGIKILISKFALLADFLFGKAGDALGYIWDKMSSLTEATQKLTKPLKDLLISWGLVAKIEPIPDEIPEVVEQTAEEIAEAARVAAELKKETDAATAAAEAFAKGYNNARSTIRDFSDEVVDSNDVLAGYTKWLIGIYEQADETVKGLVYLEIALKQVKKLLDTAISVEDAVGILRLGEAYRILTEMLNDLKESASDALTPLEAFREDLEKSEITLDQYTILLAKLQEVYKTTGMRLEEFNRLKRELDETFGQNEAMNSFLDTLGRAQKALSEDLATAFLEGESAGEAFQNFFKKMVTQILADILRLRIIQPILQGLFGLSFGAGGSVIGFDWSKSIFGGGKAAGGPVMPGGTYLVGEKGPELLKMGATGGNIVPNNQLGGATQVTYNINAVDARSFKQLVAADPEYIYNVTQVGARRQPR